MTRLPTPLRPLFPLAKRGVVATTQLVGPVTRRLPRGGARPGPPRHSAERVVDYVADHPASGVEVHEVVPALRWERAAALGRPADHWAFAEDRHGAAPPGIVAVLPRGRAIGPYGAAVTADDTLLFDLSPYYGAFRASQHPVNLRWRLPAIEDVAGSVALLTTRGVDNYYHFLFDVLPRLRLLRDAGVEVDRYLVNRSTRFQRELLARLGVAEERTITSESTPHVRADRLVVPSVPDGHLQTPPWIATWLRGELLPGDVGPQRRRLYLTRGQARHTRRVENEDEMLAALEPYGFERFDAGSLSVDEQIRAFAEAELVVGAHGAAFTNLVFCSPGTGVVELFAPDYANPCYWRLTSTVPGIRYRYLIGDGRPIAGRRSLGVASDVVVGTAPLVELVDELLA